VEWNCCEEEPQGQIAGAGVAEELCGGGLRRGFTSTGSSSSGRGSGRQGLAGGEVATPRSAPLALLLNVSGWWVRRRRRNYTCEER